MKIGIIGTRGIPNNYGGFEQFTEYLSLGLVQRGHSVFVYNSHNHPYKETVWNGVQLIHKYDPEHKIGTPGQFIYDLNCILDSRNRKFDVILFLGYTSSSVWSFLFPSKSKIITNMDGLEWKRSKYNTTVQRFLKFAEKLAVKYSDILVSDSVGIQNYLLKKYATQSKFIPYGAHIFKAPDETILSKFNLSANKYNMLIARMEPENNIEMILDGVRSSQTDWPFLVIGNYKNKFGSYLSEKYISDTRIKFLGSIYDMQVINNLRYYSNLYFHGHSVGGTNPSLLEAMASGALIVAHDNEFNRHVLQNDAFYFTTSRHVEKLISENNSKLNNQNKIDNNALKIRNTYSWENIIDQYEGVIVNSN